MNAVNQAISSTPNRESWGPTLQFAAQEVFELMLGSKLTVPITVLPNETLDITAMVGLAGQLCGVMSLRCTAKSASKMASKMLGLEPSEAGPEMWDAVGEICNMTAGNFKNKIAGLGDSCMLSVPTVITGGDYNMHSLTDGALLTATLLFEDDPLMFVLEVHN